MPELDTAYRDEEWLVVPLDTSRLPPRCLWTNAPTAGATKEIILVDANGEYEFGLLYGFRKTVTRRNLRLPVSKEWKGDQEARKREISRWMLGISIPVTVVCFVLVAALINLLSDDQLQTTPVMVTCFALAGGVSLGILATIIGFALPYLSEVPGSNDKIYVGMISDTHAWLPNPHQSYWESAPPWPEKSRRQLLLERPSFLQSAAAAWPTLLLWATAIVLIAFARVIVRGALFGKP